MIMDILKLFANGSADSTPEEESTPQSSTNRQPSANGTALQEGVSDDPVQPQGIDGFHNPWNPFHQPTTSPNKVEDQKPSAKRGLFSFLKRGGSSKPQAPQLKHPRSSYPSRQVPIQYGQPGFPRVAHPHPHHPFSRTVPSPQTPMRSYSPQMYGYPNPFHPGIRMPQHSQRQTPYMGPRQVYRAPQQSVRPSRMSGMSPRPPHARPRRPDYWY
jgi:hypothetical protein